MLRAMRSHHVLQFLAFFLGCGLVGINEVVEQFIHASHIACHTVLQHIVCIGLEAQQLGNLTTQVDDALTYLEIIAIVVVNALSILGHIHLLAQLALGAVGHERRIRWEVESEHPTFFPLCLGFGSSSLDRCIGQAFELSLISDMQGIGFVLLQQVLRKLQTQHTGLFCELTQFVLALLIEQCTTTHKTVVAVVKQSFLLFCQKTMMAMHMFHTCKEFLIEAHIIGMFCQDGLHLLCQGVHLVVGLSTQQIEENGRHAIQQVIIPLRIIILVNDGIIEGGLLWIVNRFLYQFVITTNTFHKGLFIVL